MVSVTWPWEYLAFGYLLFSLTLRLGGRQVDSWLAAPVALGTQFPDRTSCSRGISG